VNVAVEQSNAPKIDDFGSYGPPAWLPFALLLGLSALFHFSQIDLALQHKFWSPEKGWWLAKNPFIQFLYHYGTWPAVIVGGGSTLLWVGSTLMGRWQQTRPLSLFLSLLLIIGLGLIINGIFKDYFGRPRPTQTKEFGGDQPYRTLGEPGPPSSGKSFPSGHASTGFYWLGLFVYFRDRRSKLAWGFATLGLIHGLLMGFGRMAQGGHWPSDILWSAGFVYFTAWTLNYVLVREKGALPAAPHFTPVTAT
jgi:lipid A 4'-phosphatase